MIDDDIDTLERVALEPIQRVDTGALRTHPTLVMLAHPVCCMICGYRCETPEQLEMRRKSCGCYISDCALDGPYSINRITGEIEKVNVLRHE